MEHLGAREALIQNRADVYFTIEHFENFPAVLILLDRISVEDLEEAIVEGWLAVAPKKLVDAYLAA